MFALTTSISAISPTKLDGTKPIDNRELARVFVRLDHVAGHIVHANHSIV
jgi:hypothetical protein